MLLLRQSGPSWDPCFGSWFHSFAYRWVGLSLFSFYVTTKMVPALYYSWYKRLRDQQESVTQCQIPRGISMTKSGSGSPSWYNPQWSEKDHTAVHSGLWQN